MGLIDKIISAKNAVKQFASDWAAAGEQSGGEAYDAMSTGADRGVTGNIQGTVLDLASGAKNVQKQLDTYQTSSDKNIIGNTLSAVAQAPASISSGIAGVLDSDKTVTQRIDSATKAGLGVVGLLPGAAAWNVAYSDIVPKEAKKTVSDAVSNMQGDVSNFGQKLGFSKEDSDAVASILQNSIGIAAGILGPKIGKSVEGGVTKAIAGTAKVAPRSLSSIVGKASGVTANAITQSAPDLIPLAWDFYTNHGDKPDMGGKSAMISLATNMAALIPVKGLKAKIKGDIAAEQTKMNIDETPNIKIDEPIIKKVDDVQKADTYTVPQYIQDGGMPDRIRHSDKNGIRQSEFESNGAMINGNNQGKKVAPSVSDELAIMGMDKSDYKLIPAGKGDADGLYVLTKKGQEKHKAIVDGWKSPEQTSKAPEILPSPVNEPTVPKEPIAEIPLNSDVPPTPVTETVTDTPTPETPTPEKIPTPETLTEKVKKTKQKKISQETVIPEGTPITETVPPVEPTAPKKKTKEAPPPRTALATTLDNIRNSFSLDNVSVSKSKNVLNKVGTIGGYIEKGLSNVAGRAINLRNITQSVRDSGNLFANAIMDYVGVDKRKANFTRKMDIKPEDVVGGITPNEGQVINSIDEVQSVLNNIVPNSIKNFIGDKKAITDIENQAKAEYLYQIHKDNPEKLNMLFSPEEQKTIQDRVTARDTASSELAAYLVDIGLMKDRDVADNYVRYVVSEYGRDKLKLNDPVKIEINGKIYQFDSIDQALTSQMARKSKGDNHTADAMEKAISSILKSKAEGIDKFRVHSPTIQLMSYAMEMGKLMKNKATLDNFRLFMKKDKNGLPTQESEFIKGLFPDAGPSEKLENIIGINRKDTDIMGKIANGAASITRGTSSAILAGRVGTFFQPLFSSVPKGMISYVRNAIGGNAASPVGMNDIRVSEILSANGFTPDYQVFDTSPSGEIMKGVHKVAQISSGTPLETPPKKLVALSEMRRTLNENGMKTSSSPLEIVTNWEKWARDPKNKDKYLISQDKIQETIDWMGSSTIFNKSMSDTVRKTNFQALTGYVNGQVNKGLTDFGRIIGTIETGEGQRADAIKRTVGTAAIWGSVAALAYGYLKNENPDATDEEVLDMAIQYANRQSGNPLQGLYAVTSGVTSSPLSTGVGIMKDALGAGFALVSGDEGAKVKVDRLAESVIKMQGGLKTIDELTGGGLSQATADALGTVNTRDITARGYAKGINDSGVMATAFNMKPQQMLQNFVYGKLAEADLNNSINISSPVIKEAVVNTAALAKDWIRNVTTPLTDLANAFTPDRVDYGRMQAVYDTYKKIAPEDSLSSFLGKIGITDERLKNLIGSEINNLNISAKGSPDGGNILAARVTGEPGQQNTLGGDTFGKQMHDLEVENPYVYNQIISGLTSISQENERRGGMMPDKNSVDTIKSLISRSTPKDDAVIAAVSEHNPNSTSLSKALWSTYQSIVGSNPTLADTKKGIAFMDDIMKQVYQAGPWTTGLERSIALESFSTLNGLLDTAKQNGWKTVTDIIAQSPYLEKALSAGLRYRGWLQSNALENNQAPIGADGSQPSTAMTSSVPQLPSLSTDGQAMKAAKFIQKKAGSSGLSQGKAQDRKVRTISEVIQSSKRTK